MQFRFRPREQAALALLAGIFLLALLRETALFHDWELAVFPSMFALSFMPPLLKEGGRAHARSEGFFSKFAESTLRLRRFPPFDKGGWVLCLGPVASFYMVELLNQTHLWNDFAPWQVIMNLVWYALLFFVCRLVTGRDRAAAVLGSGLCFFAGLANHFVFLFRGRIIFPNDVDPAAIITAYNVSNNYEYKFDVYIFRALLLLGCYLILVARCPAQKRRVPLGRRLVLPLLAGWGIYIVVFFFTPFLPALGIYTQQWRTNANGFLLNFTIAMRYSIIEEPEGYSPQAVEEIAAQYDGTAPDPDRQPVNLICVMNEAWGDFDVFGDALKLTADPMPFYHSMRENTVKGSLYMPVTGGGTANAEYEFLTGNALAFLPINTVAYQLYIEEDMASLAHQAEDAGYLTTAVHPYYSSGWNRVHAYEDLGFEQQLYDVDFEKPAYIRQFISDASSYAKLEELTANEGQQFIFNVTMQNHSSYALSWRGLDRTVELADADGKAYAEQAAQYFSLLRASDDALREMIAYYEQSDEPTMIVMFGDHQPSITDGFYEDLYGKALNDRTAAEVQKQYATPFFIWANYDISEYKDVDLPAFALGALTAKMAGLGLTGYQELLLDLVDEFDSINPAGYLTTDGVATEDRTALSARQQELLSQYEIMSYCNLFDSEESPDEFFYLQ